MKTQRGMVWLILAFKSEEERGGVRVCLRAWVCNISLTIITFVTFGCKDKPQLWLNGHFWKIRDGPATPA